MKQITSLFLFLIVSQLALAQNTDKLIIRQPNFKVYQQSDQSYYILHHQKKVYDHLKFVGFLPYSNLQVIDKDNHAFYLDDNLKKLNKTNYQLGFCGTVPHYELQIETYDTAFVVSQRKGFMQIDSNSKTLLVIPKSKVDDVNFINMKKKFHYTSNYGADQRSHPNPKLLIYQKNNLQGYIAQEGKHKKWTKSFLYDSLTVSDGLVLLYLYGLVGYQGITDTPKYTSISPFENHLARFILPDGRKGFLDVDGKEYFDDRAK